MTQLTFFQNSSKENRTWNTGSWLLGEDSVLYGYTSVGRVNIIRDIEYSINISMREKRNEKYGERKGNG